MQRLLALTQATDDWQPADDDAKRALSQQRMQPLATLTSRSDGHYDVADIDRTFVGLVGFRPRPSCDVTGHVIGDDKDGVGRVNVVFDGGDE